MIWLKTLVQWVHIFKNATIKFMTFLVRLALGLCVLLFSFMSHADRASQKLTFFITSGFGDLYTDEADKAGVGTAVNYFKSQSIVLALAGKGYYRTLQNINSLPIKGTNPSSELENFSARLARGDQLLLYIATHGRERVEGEKTHSVLLDDQWYSLDAISSIIRQLSKKGVTVLVYDTSCYSGGTQSLADPNVCVISASNINEVANVEFSKSFWSQMKPGETAEEVFLQVRRNYTDVSSPQISSPAGNETQQRLAELTNLITLGDVDTINRFFRRKCDCPEENPQVLNTFLRSNKDVLSDGSIKNEEIEGLKSAINSFDAYLKTIEKVSLSQRRFESDLTRVSEVKYRDGSSEKLNWGQLRTADRSLEDIMRIMGKDYKDSSIDKIREQIEFRNRLRASNPEFRKFLESPIPDRKPHLESVVNQERVLYDEIFKRVNPKFSTTTNPCARFKF